MTHSNVLIIPMAVELQTRAERILQVAGLTPVEAITLFYEYLVSQGQLPGFISKFNSVTVQTFQDTDRGENVIACDHAKDLFDKLGIGCNPHSLPKRPRFPKPSRFRKPSSS